MGVGKEFYISEFVILPLPSKQGNCVLDTKGILGTTIATYKVFAILQNYDERRKTTELEMRRREEV